MPHGVQTGLCVRCGQFAPLQALSYAPKFGPTLGRVKSYTRKEDIKYCGHCAKALEAAKRRHEVPRGHAKSTRHSRSRSHYNDSRDRWGHKKQKYDM